MPRRTIIPFAALLAAGSVVFLWGGALHPATGAELGPIGSAAYFRNFARHVVEHPAWQVVHTGILAGPILWTLGCLGLRRWLSGDDGSADGSDFLSVGLGALLMGTVAWSVTFVLDGFVAPVHAAAVVAGGAGQDASLLAFRASQEIVIRLGLVAWLLLSTGVACLAVEILRGKGRRPKVRLPIGGLGLALGAWTVIAWAVGIFRPGPFTSPAWVPTAVLTALWFIALGAAAVVYRSADR